MENTYGIGVKNRYELFYDEDVDPLEIIRQQEEEKEKRKTDKAHTKEKPKIPKPGKPITTAVPKKPLKETPITNIIKPTESIDKSRTRPFDRTFKTTRSFEDSKDVEERKNFRNREDQFTGSEARDRELDGGRRGGRGGFRGRGRSRGRGNFFNNFEGRPRRDFDRHSGSDKTGVRSVDKRDGAGSNNWGDMKNEVSRKEPESWMDEEFEGTTDKHESSWKETDENEVQTTTTTRDETLPEKTDDMATENMDSKENEPVPEERPDNVREMTLDEWKREQEAKRAVPKYNLRKPGEGEDGNQWKKLYILKKKVKDDDDDEEEEEDEDVDDEEFARRGRQRQLVDIQINFNDSRRGRGRGRGVRGIGPRSAGITASKDVVRPERREGREEGPNIVGRSYGRGSSRSSKSGQQSAPRVDDWNDFPSLVTV